jgi:hypothetical protein
MPLTPDERAELLAARAAAAPSECVRCGAPIPGATSATPFPKLWRAVHAHLVDVHPELGLTMDDPGLPPA